jgi:hypothetical protein
MHYDVADVYKGPKYGRPSAQNINSVIDLAQQLNENPYVFAIPLDFTRFSCITGRAFFSVPEENCTREANECMPDLLKSRDQEGYQSTKPRNKFAS